jgi:RNA polymerase sigma-70 factor (ECF subfamily)
VLESLSPLERAVFVLREVFGYAYAEVAEALGRSEAAVRQLAHRAKSHVAARRPRFATTAEERRRVTEEFLAACVGGDMERMLELLAPDVVMWSDGGGKAQAALRPVRGAEKVARWTLGVIRRQEGEMAAWPGVVNGRPGLVFTLDGRLDTVASAEVAGGRIVALHIIRNPDKLRHVALP